MARPKVDDSDRWRHSVEYLARQRRKELKAFLIALQSDSFATQISEDRNAEIFIPLLQLAVREYGVKPAEIAERIDTKPSTISRWMNEQAKPGSSPVRESAFRAIIDILSAHLDDAR